MRRFEKLKDDAILPTRNDKGSAGYDFYINEDIVILPHQAKIISTNISAKMEENEVLLLYIRSSLGIKRHLMLSCGTGVIDSSYYGNKENGGNICCALYNYGNKVQILKSGERVMQGVFVNYLKTIDDTPLKEERVGGIGSSGK